MKAWMRRIVTVVTSSGQFWLELVLRLLGLVGRLLRWLTATRWFVWLLAQFERLERAAWGLIAALAVSVFALTTLAGLGAILGGMHDPGAGSYTATDLSDVGFEWPRVERAEEVLRTWDEADTPEGFRGPGEVLWGYVLADSLFAFGYAAVLAILLLRVGRGLQAANSPEALDSLARRRLLRRGANVDDPGLVPREIARLTTRLELNIRLATFALRSVPLLLALDLVENALTAAVFQAGAGVVLFHALWLSATLKWVLALAVIVPGLVAVLSAALFHPLAMRQLWTALVVLRLQLLLAVFFAAALLVPDQAADVLRRWLDDPADAVAAVLLTLWFAFASRGASALLLRDLRKHEAEAPGTARLVGAAIVLFIVALLGEWLWNIGQGLYVLAGILFLVGIASQALQGLDPIVRWRDAGPAADWLPRAVAAAPLVVLGVALLLATVPEVAYATHERYLVLVVLAVGLQLAGWVLAGRAPRLYLGAGRLLWLSALGVLVLAVRVWVNPWRTAEVLGSIAVLAGAMVAFTLVGFLLSHVAEHRKPPPVFTALRLRRTPAFVLLAVWFTIAALADRQGSYHDVRTLRASSTAEAVGRSSIDASNAFGAWQIANASRDGAMPLVFVSAAGGGIRAAYWVASVLDCVLEGRGDPVCQTGGEPASSRASGSVLAASGISGGSLGLASYATHLRYLPERAGWVDARLRHDYFAPTLAWTLFADFPLSFIRRSGGTDRAAVLEQAWERSWIDDRDDRSFWGFLFSWRPDTGQSPLAAGIYDLWGSSEEPQRLPVLLLGGTKVQDGCRFNASVLDIGVDTRDASAVAARESLVEDCLALHLFESVGEDASGQIYVPPQDRASWTLASTDDLSDFLCRTQDIRLSTQVNLSARFPWVEPSGRLEKCGRDGRAVHVVDGGYFDTSGASPLVELWQQLETKVEAANSAPERCLVPFFLQIDTGYSDPVQPGYAGPLELLVPVQAVAAARQAREANARQAAALAFSGPVPGPWRAALPGVVHVDRFAHIYPRAHAGSKAPLGWTLSRTAREDLKAQLALNAAEIRKVRSWFHVGLSCERT